jgi:hypothetical protein
MLKGNGFLHIFLHYACWSVYEFGIDERYATTIIIILILVIIVAALSFKILIQELSIN